MFPLQIAICGNKESEETQAFLRVVHDICIPNRVLLLANEESKSLLGERLKSMISVDSSSEDVVVYVCQKNTCSLPVSTPEELKKLLHGEGSVADT